tara:strand:- start:793 stop:1581 length:789 start_codon:yes stop_codon:yes gene_type:complete
MWGLTLSYNFETGIDQYIFYSILFFLGSVLMRSSGCIINDIADRKFDKMVSRTKNRPIASGKVSIKLALFYSIVLCLMAFLILINFNFLTICLAIASMPLAFTYPLMKRFTYWPQLFLGITFNYGLILGWTSVNDSINFIPITLYLGAIFWTLGYDTIYGYQDIKDDEIIGVKSTSIKFKNNPKKFLNICYLIFFTLITITGIKMGFSILFFTLIISLLFHLFFFQIKKFEINKPLTSYKIFKSNNFFGLILFVIILTERLI